MSKYSKFVPITLIVPVLAGCAVFKTLKEEVAILENDYRLTGQVLNMPADPSRVHVAVWKKSGRGDGSVAIVDRMSPNPDGLFALFLEPGPDYYVVVFEDPDGNDRWEKGEPLWYYGKPDPVPMNGGESVRLDATLSKNTPCDALPLAALTQARGTRSLMAISSGEQVKVVLREIADFGSREFSDPEMESQGLWEPASFLKQRGFGIYFLET